MELTLAQFLYILTMILVWLTYHFLYIHMLFIRQYHIRRFRDQWAYSDGSHND